MCGIVGIFHKVEPGTATPRIGPVGDVLVEMCLPLVAFHMRTVLSPQVEAMREPSGDQARAKTEKLGRKP